MSSSASTAALAQRYDAIAYAAIAHPLTHPDHLATIGSIFGYAPALPSSCRVLEVGCNDGSNLIPMAAVLPGSTFVGCDLSERSITAGRATVAALGLSNVSLLVQDLATLDPALGPFDYVIAHGVYSWVPQPVREALFALVQKTLAPDGLFFVSFNTLPGCRVRQAAWEMLHQHVDGIADPVARMNAARTFARLVADGSHSQHAGDDAIRAELRAIAERPDSQLFHDDLAIPNDPFYFRDVVAHAQRCGLAYLAETEIHSMSGAGITPAARQFLSSLDATAREQYLDFMRLRRFRQSILHRAGTQPVAAPFAPERLEAMHVAADPSLQRAAQAGKLGDLARELDPGPGAAAVRAWLEAMVAQAPGSVPVRQAREWIARGGGGIARGGGGAKPADALLREAYVSALVTLHAVPPPLVTSVSARPLASAVARHQAARQEMVTNLRHVGVRVAEAPTRYLLTLLDGTRDRPGLVRAMTERWSPAPGGPDAAASVDRTLAEFARLGLLTA